MENLEVTKCGENFLRIFAGKFVIFIVSTYPELKFESANFNIAFHIKQFFLR